MTGTTPTAPDRGERSGYRHPSTSYEWSNAVHRAVGPKLPHRLHAVAWALADRAQLENGKFVCWPSLNTLADDTGMDRTNIARHLKEVEAAGWIVREPGGPRRSTRYRLVIPEGVSVVAPAPLVAEVPLVAEEHPVVAEPPLPSGSSATSVVAPAPPEVSIEVPNEVSNEVRLLSYVSNAGARELPPPPRSITEERQDTYVGVFDGMGRGKPNNVDKPADPLAEYAHLLTPWTRKQLLARARAEVPDPDYTPEHMVEIFIQLFTRSNRPQTKDGLRQFVVAINEATDGTGLPEPAAVRALLGIEAA